MKRFAATIVEGHKGCAVEVPFDPGSRNVHGTLNGLAFESTIQPRMRKQWLLLDAELMRNARVGPGDEVRVRLGPKPAKKATAAQIGRVRKICLALPETTENLSHGEPTWFVNGRVFATLSNNHHGDGNIAVVCNAPEGAQEALIAAEPEHIYRPPYVGGAGWIGVRLDTGIGWKMIGALIKQAHAVTYGVRRPRRR